MPFRVQEKTLNDIGASRTSLSHYKISREWFLGFIEAEGSFIGKNQSPPIFEITQHSSDLFLFYAIQKWIGAGTVNINTRKTHNRKTVVYTLRGKDK